MSSAFLQIQAGLLAALSAAPSLGQVQVNRYRAIADGVNASLVLRLNQSAGSEGVLGTLDWQSQFSIECYARAVSGADPAATVDPLLLDVYARLAAIDPATIGAQEITFTPQIDWQYDDAATPVVCAIVQLAVRHSTSTASLQS